MSEEDDLLDELAKDLLHNPPSNGITYPISQPVSQDILDEQDLETFVNDNIQQSTGVALQVLVNFAKTVGDDPERAIAFATLLKNNNEVIKLLNDRLIKQKENKTKIKIQELKESGNVMEKLAEANASVVGKRDEIFRELFKQPVDVESEPISSD